MKPKDHKNSLLPILRFVLNLLLVYLLINVLFPDLPIPNFRDLPFSYRDSLINFLLLIGLIILFTYIKKGLERQENKEQEQLKRSGFDLRLKERIKRKQKIRKALFLITLFIFAVMIYEILFD